MESRARTRIAPTPSGFLHQGNAVSFLLTAQLARMHSAALRLRIDDLDADRTRSHYLEDIFTSLSWLGIPWGEGPRDVQEHAALFTQAKRLDRYMEFIGILKEQEDLYACTCSRSVLRTKSAPCTCRAQRIPFERPDVTWKLHIPADAVVRMQCLFGPPRTLVPADLIPDPVIKQRNNTEDQGSPAYQIASLADDVDHHVTFIVRGEDLLPSTACQLYLADRLGREAFKNVRFVHHPLITDPAGQKLSKSAGASSLKAMREQGGSPAAMQAQAAQLLEALVLDHSMP